ncbi:DUF547 domain-containing protein [Pontibacter roseus]|uniref:DUF547 domain-containing protein n=1 Tax=Pontibacter roseus TaxID=336989 RepID=UPI00036741F7|nr:DUF547 domain-containing protein [Pontibacter roseus]
MLLSIRFLHFLPLFALLLFGPVSCLGSAPAGASQAIAKPDHQRWTQLLQKHVAADGDVDYKGMKQDRKELQLYLNQLSKGVPDPKTWSREEQLAYWINAYNAYTVKLIVDNYPLKSIKDLNATVSVPLVNTIWDDKFIKLGGKEYSLNDIEHRILRKEFDEPRIHFAVNCASKSCPKLSREAYTASKLEKQLEEQTLGFINDPKHNRITPDNPKVSAIFDWFGGDFKKKGSLTDFINRYSKVKIKPGANITFLDYDWNLNE